jgi:hypothetical protein
MGSSLNPSLREYTIQESLIIQVIGEIAADNKNERNPLKQEKTKQQLEIIVDFINASRLFIDACKLELLMKNAKIKSIQTFAGYHFNQATAHQDEIIQMHYEKVKHK